MKARVLIPALMLSGITALGNVAVADDQLAGALIGAGAGAIIGDSIDSRDGAIVGGFLGAMLGAAIADDDDRRVVHRHHYRPYYGPPAYVRLPPPRVYYAPPSHYYGKPMPHWKHDHRDGRWDRDDDRGRGGRDGRWDRHDDRGRDGRGGHRPW